MQRSEALASAQLSASVRRVLAQCKGLENDSRLVVGVSGGPDSLALLHLLANEFFDRQRLLVAHLDHQIRASAAVEAQEVARICRAWGIECRLGVEDVQEMAREQRLSLEDAARRARYRFLAEVAHDFSAEFVAVGHHADDQAETVLMHFLRGAGLAGLRGMQPVSGMANQPGVSLIRPFLHVGRALIETYCAEQELEPLLDESNLDNSFFRNRLRHELLPFLESYNPRIRQGLQHSADVLAADYELLESLRQSAWEEITLAAGDGWLRMDLAGWQALPLSIRRMTLRQAAWQLRQSLRDVSYLAVENARTVLERGEVGKRATLPGDIILTVGYDDWTVAAPGAVPPAADLPQIDVVGELPTPGRIALAGGWEIEAESPADIRLDTVMVNRDPWTAFVAADSVTKLSVRGRGDGERFQPMGMGGRSARVKDVMINVRMPADARRHWPIVALEDHLVWLVGHQIDERVRVRESGPVIKLTCRRRTAD